MKPRQARVKQATRCAKGFAHTTCWAAAMASVWLVTSGTHAADDRPVKPPIRGLVSMGAFKFVGSGGDPVNTLEPLNAKPGIFAGWAMKLGGPPIAALHNNKNRHVGTRGQV